ncbi:PilZ domain-containing protein [Methylocaldum sp.]|uniref:PilZ domain-containing protein n=1 Tax=Methylocaldum sp. TaxID=1969727 RepID=UPI002D23E521|nr:PilZ domain-containing protein [Methylocaldum sp.]HYE37811.1 PilZ domain-containing protein [Methylocaldum sp.]
MPSIKPSEKRHFHRVAHDAAATLSHKNESFPCKILDLSLKGCLIELNSDQLIDSEDIYDLRVNLNETVHISMGVSLAHRSERKIGFVCRRIDLDSVSALRRLVELNLGDAELLERDLQALALGAGG